jgi:hypothetical protein
MLTQVNFFGARKVGGAGGGVGRNANVEWVRWAPPARGRRGLCVEKVAVGLRGTAAPCKEKLGPGLSMGIPERGRRGGVWCVLEIGSLPLPGRQS